jgi:hypothetical protein
MLQIYAFVLESWIKEQFMDHTNTYLKIQLHFLQELKDLSFNSSDLWVSPTGDNSWNVSGSLQNSSSVMVI